MKKYFYSIKIYVLPFFSYFLRLTPSYTLFLKPYSLWLKSYILYFIIVVMSIFFVQYKLFARTPVITQEEVLVGTAPLGMSSAYVASADNVNAIDWNPAGLGFMKNNEVYFSVPLNPIWSRDLEMGFNNFYGAFAMPLNKKYMFGVSWLHIGYSDDPALNWNNKAELEYNEEKISISMARKFSAVFRIGVSLKYYRLGINYDGSVERTGNGAGMDIGISYMPMEKLRLGLLLNNVFTAVMLYDDNTYKSFMSPAVKFGAAYSFVKNNTVELTVDDMIHLGVEQWFFNMFGVRAGIQKEILNFDEPFSFSGGFGFRLNFMQIDYAAVYNNYFGLSHSVAATYRFGFHAYQIDVMDIGIHDMFASQYKIYADTDVVKVKLKNKSKKPLKVKVGFFVNGYMDTPTEKNIVLKPNMPTIVTLPAVFNNNIMDRTEDGFVTGKIILTYEYDKQKSVDEATKEFTLYGRNAFVWDKLEPLAVFVTPKDETIKRFTRGVIQLKAQDKLHDEFISDNFYYAMLLFAALGEYGMTYVVDPSTPFEEVASISGAIDTVQFPMESLQTKTGDCDDVTVLFASCLANIGIPSAFIDVPGHIYMMFYLNMNTDKAKRVFGSEDYFVNINGEAWLPVETTMFGKPFLDALKEGRNELEKWSGAIASGAVDENAVRIVAVQNAWKKYPSAQLNDSFEAKLPAKDKLIERYEKDVDKVLKFLSPAYVKAKKKVNKFPKMASAYNELGLIYANYDIYTVAEKYFKKAIALNKKYSSSYVNLGNIYTLNAKYGEAIKYYNMALKLEPKNKKILKNLAKAKQLQQEELK